MTGPSLAGSRLVRDEASAVAGQPVPLRVSDPDVEVSRVLPRDEAPATGAGPGAWTVLTFAHITDFQHADLASPLRNDHLQRYAGDPYWRRMLPAYRPQEFLQWHALATVVATLHEMQRDPELAVELVVTTGDATDSAQADEVAEYLTLMNGGTVRPGRHNDNLSATPSFGDDDSCWLPGVPDTDRWKRQYGFPFLPGIRELAAAEFEHRGLDVPWLACLGNHDVLVQGRADASDPSVGAALDEWLVGDAKPAGQREPSAAAVGVARDAYDAYLLDPTTFLAGTTRPIPADPERRLVDRRGYLQAHLDAPSVLPGHGFTTASVAEDRGYYVYDGFPGVRFITLDTNNPRGDVDGCVTDDQFTWLRERLAEVHSRYRTADGETVVQDVPNRLVILLSHHGVDKLTNKYGFDEDDRIHLADDVVDLLAGFDNVVLWLNGHTHVNRVAARSADRPTAPLAGFWEVGTSAVAEWPVQVRRMAIEVAADGRVAVSTVMVDSIAPAMPNWPCPGSADVVRELASVHRWIAANDPGSVGGVHADGETDHRRTRLTAWVPQATARDVLAQSGSQIDPAAEAATEYSPESDGSRHHNRKSF